MEKQVQTKTVVCRYGTEMEYLKLLKKFGWELSSKRLLNRFGNTLPPNEKLTESELIEKCSYELTVSRIIDPELGLKLNSIENEYESLILRPNHFGGGRVTAMVFLSIAILALSIVSGVMFSEGDSSVGSTLLIFDLLAIGGLIAIIVTGAFIVAMDCKENESLEKEKKRLLDEAEKMLLENK
ncbi:MAG: hypothetical protein IJK27_03290 [Bacilli bacterium]|nr:hypothetical protein [Bacilli bacterium]